MYQTTDLVQGNSNTKPPLFPRRIWKMKKKLLALLLASSMALMNVAPAYGTDIFTDPEMRQTKM